MPKTKKDWKENFREFEKMRLDNITNIKKAEKNLEDIEFFMAAIKGKIETFK